MRSSRLTELLQQYANGSLNAAGEEELSVLLSEHSTATEAELTDLISQQAAEGNEPLPDNWRAAVNAIMAVDTIGVHTLPRPAAVISARVSRRHILARWSWAAAVLIVLLAAGYYWVSRPEHSAVVKGKQTQTDAAPGTNGAILTLSDGSQLVLDSLGNGVLTTQQGAKVRLQNGVLQYDPQTTASTQQPPAVQFSAYNVMTTPKGRQFQLLLPDGTRVWLNAASSIRYPTAFTAGTRTVELTGEAYFEVSRNKAQPFVVHLSGFGGEVEVTGTHFNVKAYADETSASTTLLEGAVTVRTSAQQQAMKPGGQTSILPGGQLTLNPEADTEQAVAWKNRSFSFKKTELESILKQLARWYDIEILYEGPVPKKTFTSNLSMDNNLSDILTILRSSGIRFSFENGILRVK